MSFLSLLAVLVLEQLRPLSRRNPLLLWNARYAEMLARHFNSGEYRSGVIAWMLGIVPLAAGVWLVYALLAQVSPLLCWAWNVAVLYFTMGLRQFSDSCSELELALRAGDSERARQVLARWRAASAAELADHQLARAGIEQGLLTWYRQVFGVMVWFVLLPGPSGAVLYRLATWMSAAWDGEAAEARLFAGFARKAHELLDWLPARMAALSFAVVGDFEDALYCWRTQASAWLRTADGIVLASAAGALGVKLGGGQRPQLGTGEEAEADHLQSVVGLAWRALVVWLLLLLLLTIANWVG